MAIVSVVQGLVETESGKVFELDSSKGSTWVESVTSFRYVPTEANKPYTVRQETKKGGDYWYGYRKVSGKLHKKYIGKSSELSTAKLEEIAEALNTPQQPRVTQVTGAVTQVTESVTDKHTAERVTALELQVQALRESLEALRSELSGKSLGLSNSSKLLNPGAEVTENKLRTELSNLEAENEKLRTDYAALLESSTAVTNKLREEVRELRSQLETEKTRGEEIWEEMEDSEKALAEVRSENLELKKTCSELRSENSDLKQELAAAPTENPEPEQKATPGIEFPEAAKIYNQFKAENPKTKTTYKEVVLILARVQAMIEKS